LKGSIILTCGKVKGVWEITDGGISIVPIDGFFVLTFYAQTLEPTSISLGNGKIEQDEASSIDAIQQESVNVQIQYRLHEYDPAKLKGAVFKEQTHTDIYDTEETANFNNILIHLHGPVWDSSVEFIDKTEGLYHIKVKGISDALQFYFQNGENTIVGVDCWAELSSERVHFW
jgi:hypothetical protein